MLQTVEQEPLLLYLLDELGEQERKQIEERYFADNEYFDDLLKLEEELVEEYYQEKSTLEHLGSQNRTSKVRLEDLWEVTFAKEWTRGLELKDLSGHQLAAVAEFYERELNKAKVALREQEAENLLEQAWSNRQLMSTLIEGDWLGLKILTVLSLTPGTEISASNLVTALDGQVDHVVSLLIRLVQFGAVKQDQNLFSLTQRGAAVIKNLASVAPRS